MRVGNCRSSREARIGRHEASMPGRKRSSKETMFTLLFIKVFERMHGRALAAVIAEAANGAVTDRTVRNWLGARTSPGLAEQAALLRNARVWLEQSLESRDWPPAERAAYVEGLNACPGIVSGFLFGVTGASDNYPASLQLAGDIDLLEIRLDEHRTAGNVAAYAEELLTTEWLLDEHFVNPDHDDGAEATRRQLREANSWEELAVPLAPVAFNLQLQLLATLDLEFCRDYLKGFAVERVFDSLLPRLNPRIDLERENSVPIVRDAFHYPSRRLLDVMACMRSFPPRKDCVP